jgi:hypothetical protein
MLRSFTKQERTTRRGRWITRNSLYVHEVRNHARYVGHTNEERVSYFVQNLRRNRRTREARRLGPLDSFTKRQDSTLSANLSA